MTYAIKHSVTGLFFAGFGPAPEFMTKWQPSKPVVWSDETHAKAQAVLLRRFDNAVQLKPVRT